MECLLNEIREAFKQAEERIALLELALALATAETVTVECK